MSRGNSFSSKQMDSLEDSVLVSIIVHLGQSIFGKTNFDTKLWTSAPPKITCRTEGIHLYRS